MRVYDTLEWHFQAWIDRPGPVTSAALDDAVRALTVAQLAALASDLRAGHLAGPLRFVEPVVIRRLLERAPSVGAAGIVSLHRNGFVRQVGVEALAGTDDLEALRFLALRLDDIVPALRNRASVEVARRIVPRQATQIAALLPLFRGLGLRRRAGAGGTLHSIDAFLVDPAGGREALLAATRAPDPTLRLRAYMLAARKGALGAALGPLLAAALADPDRRIFRWAALELTSTRISDTVREPFLDALFNHRDPYLRRRVVLARARGDGARPFLLRALLDPRAVVRRAAREKLRDGDSRRVYLDALGARPDAPARRDLLGALAGLSEVGIPGDAACALRWASVDDGPIQAEAVHCLASLDVGAHVETFHALRTSRYGRVRREAERALARARVSRT